MPDPIQAKYIEQMNEIARLLDRSFNIDQQQRTTGFCLLVFKFGEPTDQKRMNYISNANRQDMLCALKEFIAHCEGRALDTPGHA